MCNTAGHATPHGAWLTAEVLAKYGMTLVGLMLRAHSQHACFGTT